MTLSAVKRLLPRFGFSPDSTLGFTLSVVSVMAILIALISWLDFQRQRDNFRVNLELSGFRTADTLSGLLENPLYLSKIDDLRDIAKGFESAPNISYVQIFEPNGDLIVEPGQHKYPEGSVRDEFALSAIESRKVMFRFNGESLDVASPIVVGTEVRGGVQFGLDAPPSTRGIIRDHVLQGLVLMAGAAPLSYLLVHYFGTRRRRAEEALHREQLQALSQRLVDTQEAERRHVARELHDEASQALTSLKVGLSLLEREADCPPEVIVSRVAELKQVTGDVMENLHRLAMDLRPASLDQLGLVAAVRQYVQAFGRQHSLPIEFETIGLDGERLLPDVETALYRIVQEALTNVVRHAQATRAGVVLERRDDRVVAIVEDDGKGFDPEAAVQYDRLGLFGMRERAEMLSGSLVVESKVGSGTTLFAEVSYVQSHPDRR